MKHDVEKWGAILRSYATHHDHGDGWVYTRDTGDLEAIYYKSSRTGYDHWTKRLKRALNVKQLLGRDGLSKQLGLQPRGLKDHWYTAQAHFIVNFRRSRSIPDGQINGNPMHWEEDGEYIQCVGPTVGVKIADFLENEPENPYAVAIAEEMNRIWELSMQRHREYEASFNKEES